MRTPLSLARVYEARTSSGLDWSGIRPESSLTIRPRSAGGASKTPKEPWSIGLRQEEQRAPTVIGPGADVTWATWGMRASDGSGWLL